MLAPLPGRSRLANITKVYLSGPSAYHGKVQSRGALPSAPPDAPTHEGVFSFLRQPPYRFSLTTTSARGCITMWPGGTLCVMNTPPPTTQSSPITVSPPRITAPA